MKKTKTKVGKFYQIGGKHAIKADRVLLIETNEAVKEHAKIDSLPKVLKEKLEKKGKKGD